MVLNTKELKIIEDLKILRKIIKKETYIEIFAILLIYGKLTYEEIKLNTNLSKATIFRALDLLREGGFVNKTENKEIKDKRKQTTYYLTSSKLTVQGINNKIVTYLKLHDELTIMHDIRVNSSKVSNIIARVVEKKNKNHSDKSVPKRVNFFQILDRDNADDLYNSILKLIEKFETQNNNKRDLQEEIKNPVFVNISFRS